jgi:hypothetical protein
MAPFRTTVTLDPDVAEQLKSLARKRDISFKEALNATVRAGLVAERGGSRPYQTPTWPMHFPPNIDLTHALQLAADLEDGEILRKMALRK